MVNEREKSVAKLREMVEGIDFCMMTTVDNGQLRCRPMSTQAAEFDGEVWFFARDNSHKIDEIEKDNRVCLGYAKPDDSTYVSVSGRAEITKDRAKMEELWSPILKAWFPRWTRRSEYLLDEGDGGAGRVLGIAFGKACSAVRVCKGTCDRTRSGLRREPQD
jgi:general stress protein 26